MATDSKRCADAGDDHNDRRDAPSLQEEKARHRERGIDVQLAVESQDACALRPHPNPAEETVPNLGAIMLPAEMSSDAGSCCRDPRQTSR
jgi:hypothetical protein